MKESRGESVLDSTARLQRAARERADDEARRVPWQRLYDSRNQYIDWQEFYLWVRSILEVAHGIPDWLAEILNASCPGFLETEKTLAPKAVKTTPLHFRLETWIDDHIFASAKHEGCFFTITYYAIREPRYQRAEVCWSECVEKWKKAKPAQYPSFEEWKGMAAQCDETAHLTVRERKARASAKLVHPDRLAEASARYMDCEALAYWARHALEHGAEVPSEVVRELEQRCPGYLEAGLKAQEKNLGVMAQDWEHMMLWVAEHFFQDAKTEGWFEAILIQVRNHPRAIRTMEYADHCDEVWSSELPSPYARIAHSQHPASDELAKSWASYTKSCLQRPQRPSVSDLATDPEC